jgi:hypothetical protein
MPSRRRNASLCMWRHDNWSLRGDQARAPKRLWHGHRWSSWAIDSPAAYPDSRPLGPVHLALGPGWGLDPPVGSPVELRVALARPQAARAVVLGHQRVMQRCRVDWALVQGFEKAADRLGMSMLA